MDREQLIEGANLMLKVAKEVLAKQTARQARARSPALKISRNPLFMAENTVHSLTNSSRFLQIPPSEPGLNQLPLQDVQEGDSQEDLA